MDSASLLFALIAFQRGHLTREQLLEATAAWMSAPGTELSALLVDGKYLKPDQAASVAQLVSEWRRAHDTATVAPPMSKELRDTMVALRRGGGPKTETLASERYAIGAEIGRGGIGRVVEAEDRELGRTVALKLVLKDGPWDLVERFQWEARVTGRLDHPNVVPVHDMGVLGASNEVFLSMKRIVGRDMAEAMRDGLVKPRRLVEALRDVCRAVAYAHSRGVVHRDLKPANIMLGDFGEVLVVDWGLARLLGEEDRPSTMRRATSKKSTPPRPRIAKPEETKGLTLDGDILGTPAYMPPEQALGRTDEVDERSDVWAIGAILYEILAGRTPFDGENARDVIERVVSLPVPPPSSVRRCTPELEAIAMKALAFRKEDRWQSARALGEELEAYLEGTKEKERRLALAEEQVAHAAAAMARRRGLAFEAAALEAESRAEGDAEDGIPKKQWALEDRALERGRESAEALAEASDALSSALTLAPDHSEARGMRAELMWDQYLEAEIAGDERRMIYFRRAAERSNDGALDSRLRGDGTLEVRTRAWPCRCLVHGREVAPADLWVRGYHPWSGRRKDGVDIEAFPEFEPAAPLRLRVHGAACRRVELPGAEAWAFRYEETDRRLLPVTPSFAFGGAAVPREILDGLFGDSPYRPRGPGLHLGATPLEKRPWPMGSWLLVVAAPGRAPVRVPFSVPRQGEVALDVTLFTPEETPPGFLPVAGGSFESIRDTGPDTWVTRRELDLEDVFIARHPVTCRAYREWIDELAARDPAEARARLPRNLLHGGYYWPPSGSSFAIPTAAWLASAPPDARALASRVGACAADWEEDWPVLAVTWKDAIAWSLRETRRTGWIHTLPNASHWERAARGADRRDYPWGRESEAARWNSNRAFSDGPRPVRVSEFPDDESPFGIRGLAGNACAYSLNEPPQYRRWRNLLGGAWNRAPHIARISNNQGTVPVSPGPGQGFRSMIPVQLDAP